MTSPLSSTARASGATRRSYSSTTGFPERAAPPAPTPPTPAEQLLSKSCPCPLESFVRVLPVPRPAGDTAAAPTAVRRGILRYVGPTDFADGVWAGVELVGTLGRNSGFGKAQEYFKCLPGQGVFVRPELIRPFVEDGGGGEATVENQKDPAPTLHTAEATDSEAKATALARAAEAEARLLAAEHEKAELQASLAAATAAAAAREAAIATEIASERAARRAAEASLAALLSSEDEAGVGAAPEPTATAATAEDDDGHGQALAELEARVRGLETDLEQGAQRHAEERRQAQQREADLQAGHDRVSHAHAAATAELAASEAQRVILEQQLAQVEQALARAREDAQRESDRLEEEAAAGRARAAELAQLHERVARLTAEAASYQQQLVEAKQAAASASETMRSERARLEQALAEATHRAERAEVGSSGPANAAAPAPAPTPAAGTDADRSAQQQQPLQSAQDYAQHYQALITALTAERDELQEMCDLQEAELHAGRVHSDETAALLQQLTEDAAMDRARWEAERETLTAHLAARTAELHEAQRVADEWRQRCDAEQQSTRGMVTTSDEVAGPSVEELQRTVMTLTNELDAARMRVFQLEKAMETFAGLQQQLATAAEELAAAKRKAKAREQRLMDDYEDTLAHVRGAKDRAQAECAQLREEVDRLERAAAVAAADQAEAHRIDDGGRGGPPALHTGTREGGHTGTGMHTAQGTGAEGRPGEGAGGHARLGMATEGTATAQVSHAPPTFSSLVPLSDWERTRWEATVRRLEDELLTLRAHRLGRTGGGARWLAHDASVTGEVCQATTAASLLEAVASAVRRDREALRGADSASADVPYGTAAVGSSRRPPRHVLDFSTPAARAVSARALFQWV